MIRNACAAVLRRTYVTLPPRTMCANTFDAAGSCPDPRHRKTGFRFSVWRSLVTSREVESLIFQPRPQRQVQVVGGQVNPDVSTAGALRR